MLMALQTAHTTPHTNTLYHHHSTRWRVFRRRHVLLGEKSLHLAFALTFLAPLLTFKKKKKSISSMWFRCYVSLFMKAHYIFLFLTTSTATFHTHIRFHYIIDTTTFDTPKHTETLQSFHVITSFLHFLMMPFANINTLQQPTVQSSLFFFLSFFSV